MTYFIPVRKQLIKILCGIALSAAVMLSAHAENNVIQVFMNNARILKLDRPVSKVIIGNSEIADVTVSDSQTIILTGKAYGATNLVILDRKGDAIVDERVLVSVDEANTLRVYKSTNRSVLSCSPACEINKN